MRRAHAHALSHAHALRTHAYTHFAHVCTRPRGGQAVPLIGAPHSGHAAAWAGQQAPWQLGAVQIGDTNYRSGPNVLTPKCLALQAIKGGVHVGRFRENEKTRRNCEQIAYVVLHARTPKPCGAGRCSACGRWPQLREASQHGLNQHAPWRGAIWVATEPPSCHSRVAAIHKGGAGTPQACQRAL